MKRRNGSGRWIWVVLSYLLWVTGAQAAGALYQVSTIDALLAGEYDGVVTVGELGERGEVGIGTFAGLDGELVFLDGVVYQVLVDGSVEEAGEAVGVPFATVSDGPEAAGVGERIAAEDLESLLAGMADRIGLGNVPVVVRLRGTFEEILVRSVPRQTKPYPPLAEVVEEQAQYRYGRDSGELVGYWTPGYFKGINVPGWHLHYLSEDRERGGHVLGLSGFRGELRARALHQIEIELPQSDSFAEVDLERDREAELKKVEKGVNGGD